MKLTCKCAASLLAAGLAAAAAAQQTYPTKPIRLVVGFAPGGNTDTVARLVGQRLGERLGTQVIVDDWGGAGGTIGTEMAARANPDGYTLTMGTTTTHTIAVAAYPQLRYDPGPRFCAGRNRRDRTVSPRRQFDGAREVAQGLNGVRQKRKRQAQLRLGRTRDDDAPCHGNAHNARRINMRGGGGGGEKKKTCGRAVKIGAGAFRRRAAVAAARGHTRASCTRSR